MASDISRGRLVRLPWDYADYGLEPDEQSVAGAARASASIPFEFARALVSTMMSFHDHLHLDDPCVVRRTIFVDTSGVRPTDFDLDDAAKTRLHERGRRATETFLDTWDFEAYVADCRA